MSTKTRCEQNAEVAGVRTGHIRGYHWASDSSAPTSGWRTKRRRLWANLQLIGRLQHKSISDINTSLWQKKKKNGTWYSYSWWNNFPPSMKIEVSRPYSKEPVNPYYSDSRSHHHSLLQHQFWKVSHLRLGPPRHIFRSGLQTINYWPFLHPARVLYIPSVLVNTIALMLLGKRNLLPNPLKSPFFLSVYVSLSLSLSL